MPVPRRRPHAGVCTLFIVLLVCLFAVPVPSGAVPVIAEAQVRAAAGDVHGAARVAAQKALGEAVRVVVRRHVRAVDLADHSSSVQRAVLNRAPRFVSRYSIADENWDDLTVVVRVEAEVDRERVLTRLADAGVPVVALAVKPRLLIVALEPAAEAALGPLVRTLEVAGYPSHIGARPTMQNASATVDEDRVGRWARTAGCHLALVVESAADQRSAGSGDTSRPPPSWSGGLWFDPGGEPARATLRLVSWLVDPAGRLPLGKVEARGEGFGGDQPAADRAAADIAGRQIGYQALERLEQSRWTPEGVLSELQVEVSGLVDPLLVEEIGVALAAVPEVRGIQLAEVSRLRAAWRLQVMDAGLDWAAVLTTARLPRGQLTWGTGRLGFNPTAAAYSGAAPAPALPSLTALWQGP